MLNTPINNPNQESSDQSAKFQSLPLTQDPSSSNPNLRYLFDPPTDPNSLTSSSDPLDTNTQSYFPIQSPEYHNLPTNNLNIPDPNQTQTTIGLPSNQQQLYPSLNNTADTFPNPPPPIPYQ